MEPLIVRTGLLFRIGFDLTTRKIARNNFLSQAQRNHILGVLNNKTQLHSALGELDNEVQQNAEALAALHAPPVAGKQHPFVEWLLTHWSMVYAIIQEILAIFGVVLPPLPTIPPPVVGTTPTAPGGATLMAGSIQAGP